MLCDVKYSVCKEVLRTVMHCVVKTSFGTEVNGYVKKCKCEVMFCRVTSCKVFVECCNAQ